MGRLFLLIFVSIHLSAKVTALYLSWYDDPTTTMTIQWLSLQVEPEEEIFLEREGRWQSVEVTRKELSSLFVYAAHLKQLTPDTEYCFRIGDSPIYKFRTAPASLEKSILRFCVGGDAYGSRKLFCRMNKTLLKKDPLFAVINGDIAYARTSSPIHLRSYASNRWISFLRAWTEQMITADRRVIPFLLVAGNHDIASDDYKLFFTLFDFPQRQLYRTLDFGNYLSLILLDTGHFQPIEGRQTLWLSKALAQRTDRPHRFAIYHEAAYPSFYPYENSTSKKIRTYWCPLFDHYRLPVVFESHNHTFKQTYPLRANRIDPEGVLYFGDGCWGVTPRKTNEMWYLEKRARKNHVYLLELHPEKAKVQAIGLLGDLLDERAITTGLELQTSSRSPHPSQAVHP